MKENVSEKKAFDVTLLSLMQPTYSYISRNEGYILHAIII